MTDPFYEDESVRLFHGDCLDVLLELPDCSVDAVVTDPPYGLGFMGREWDDLLPGIEFATECLRVLKPGGHMLAFGGSRTWHRLTCAVEDAGFEIRDSIAWLYGSGFPKSLDVSKAIDKAAGAQSEVVGRTVTPFKVDAAATRGTSLEGSVNGDFSKQTDDDGYRYTEHTAPATPDAERWQGWGTALKPAYEPVVVGRKPLGLQGILDTIGSHLDVLEAAWQAPEAAPTTRTGGEDDSPAQTDTLPSELETPTNWNTVKSWRACWAELCDLTNTFTTATTSRTTTDLRTLSSSLSKLTQENTPPNGTSPHGLTSLVLGVDNLFASVVCGLRGTLALSVTEPATSSTQHQPLDAAEPNRPAFEPIVVARKPLAGTVAGNVLAYGTGALNIDGCRILTDELKPYSPGVHRDSPSSYNDDGWQGSEQVKPPPAGRWPANVVLDESQAAELDKQSGTRIGSRTASPGNESGEPASGVPFVGGKITSTYDDLGGASRFFPTFRYEPKAPSTERPRDGQTAHPTVKPLDLMRWLVRLVTPPGGTVLEPFAGSGTTAEACVIEGFNCIAIEREADYLPLIVQRLSKPIQVALDFS